MKGAIIIFTLLFVICLNFSCRKDKTEFQFPMGDYALLSDGTYTYEGFEYEKNLFKRYRVLKSTPTYISVIEYGIGSESDTVFALESVIEIVGSREIEAIFFGIFNLNTRGCFSQNYSAIYGNIAHDAQHVLESGEIVAIVEVKGTFSFTKM